MPIINVIFMCCCSCLGNCKALCCQCRARDIATVRLEDHTQPLLEYDVCGWSSAMLSWAEQPLRLAEARYSRRRNLGMPTSTRQQLSYCFLRSCRTVSCRGMDTSWWWSSPVVVSHQARWVAVLSKWSSSSNNSLTIPKSWARFSDRPPDILLLTYWKEK